MMKRIFIHIHMMKRYIHDVSEVNVGSKQLQLIT